MVAHSFFFYFFSIIAIFASAMVIFSKNTVNSVFFLILDFISISFLFIMIGAEFLGMIMLIVYVGAVAVLFLFVVMMLNLGLQKENLSSYSNFSTHIPSGLLVGVIIFLELIVVVGGWKYKDNFISTDLIKFEKNISNTHELGNVLYTDYIHLFQLAGILLLVSMIGAIVLTFRKREGIKKQSVIAQISRERSDSIKLVNVESNKGVNIDE